MYATGNPQACFELGTGQTEISLRIPIGTQCGSVQSVGVVMAVFCQVDDTVSDYFGCNVCNCRARGVT